MCGRACEPAVTVLLRPSRRALFTGCPRCCAAPQTKDADHGDAITIPPPLRAARGHRGARLQLRRARRTRWSSCPTSMSRPAGSERPPRGRRHGSGRRRSGRDAPIEPSPAAAPGAGDVKVELPSGIVTNTTVTGASTTVITSTDIERNPGVTIQDLLSRQPGIQVRSLFGGVNGAASTVDLRGFGATASNNTLVLINGRRHQRPRSRRRRSQHAAAREHRSHRDHPRQQRRGALRRRRGRRRHQHRHQDRHEPAAVGADRRHVRLVQIRRRRRVGQRLV